MRDKQTLFQQLITERLDELEWSLREVERQSGGQVTASALSLILTGRIKRPTARILNALSATLDIPIADIKEAVADSAEAKAQRRLPARAAKLSPQGHSLLIKFLDYLLALEADR